MDEQLNAINERFDKIEIQQKETNNQLTQIKSELRVTNERVGINSSELGRIKTEMRDTKDQVIAGFNKTDKRFDRLEYNHQELRLDMNTNFEETNTRIDGLFIHVDGIVGMYNNHDCEIAALQHVFERHDKILNKL